MADLIGVISDTHGRAERAGRAVELLCALGAHRIIHLGDVGSESVLDHLAGVPSTVVFGNCDDERSLARYAAHMGIEVVHPAAVIEVKSLRIGVTHGHLEHEVRRLVDERVDVLLHGHTHEIRDERIGGVRIMNPGALHRAPRPTVMLLDMATGAAHWIDIEDGTTVQAA